MALVEALGLGAGVADNTGAEVGLGDIDGEILGDGVGVSPG